MSTSPSSVTFDRSAGGSGSDNERRPTGRRRRHRKRKPKQTTVKKPHDRQTSNKDIIFCLRIETAQLKDLNRHRILSVVSRVVLVNYAFEVVVDNYVRPQPPPQPKGAPVLANYEIVSDATTTTTSSTDEPLWHEYADVQQVVRKQLRGRILIGHKIEQSLRLLGMSHPDKNMRDASRYKPFMNKIINNGEVQFAAMELKDILYRKLNIEDTGIIVQAKGCMNLYRTFRPDWEAENTAVLQQKDYMIKKQQDQEKRERHLRWWKQQHMDRYGTTGYSHSHHHHHLANGYRQQTNVPRTVPGSSYYSSSEYSYQPGRPPYDASSYTGRSVESAPAAIRPYPFLPEDGSSLGLGAPHGIEYPHGRRGLDARSCEWATPNHHQAPFPSVGRSTNLDGDSYQSGSSSVWTPTKDDTLNAQQGTDEKDLLPSDLLQEFDKTEPDGQDVPVDALNSLWLEGNNDLHLKNSW